MAQQQQFQAPYAFTNTDSNGDFFLDILCYADAGCTKTTQIATLKQAGFNPFILSCEHKATLSLRGHNIDGVVCDSFSAARQFVNDAWNNQFFRAKGYDFVCLDGASTLSFMALKETASKKDRRLEYAEAYINFKNLIDDLRKFGVHLYVNAHAVLNKANNKIGPKVEGDKFCVDFAGMFATVFNIRNLADNSGVNHLVFQTFDDGVYNCKDRNLTVDFKPKLDNYEIADLQSGGLGRVCRKMLQF